MASRCLNPVALLPDLRALIQAVVLCRLLRLFIPALAIAVSSIALISLIILALYVAHPWVELCRLLLVVFLVAKELVAVIFFGSTCTAAWPKGSVLVSLLTTQVIYLVGGSTSRSLGFEVE